MKLNLIAQAAAPDYSAPDGSEIRLSAEATAGGLAHATPPSGRTSKAVRHRTVEEIWYVTAGRGEVWRKLVDEADVVAVSVGTSVTIPVGTHFQFRTVGSEALCLVIATMPRWPGPDEAVPVDGHW